MAKALIDQAKSVDIGTLGFKMMHGGSFVVIDCEESGDKEQINLGEDMLAFFALGIIMERRRAEKPLRDAEEAKRFEEEEKKKEAFRKQQAKKAQVAKKESSNV